MAFGTVPTSTGTRVTDARSLGSAIEGQADGLLTPLRQPLVNPTPTPVITH
jgi:hypothetical protein